MKINKINFKYLFIEKKFTFTAYLLLIYIFIEFMDFTKNFSIKDNSFFDLQFFIVNQSHSLLYFFPLVFLYFITNDVSKTSNRKYHILRNSSFKGYYISVLKKICIHSILAVIFINFIILIISLATLKNRINLSEESLEYYSNQLFVKIPIITSFVIRNIHLILFLIIIGLFYTIISYIFKKIYLPFIITIFVTSIVPTILKLIGLGKFLKYTLQTNVNLISDYGNKKFESILSYSIYMIFLTGILILVFLKFSKYSKWE